jgi:hypothetical protein
VRVPGRDGQIHQANCSHLRSRTTLLARSVSGSQDFRRPSPRHQPGRSTTLPAVAWRTLAPKCEGNLGPQTRSAVRTFIPPLQPRSPRACWRPGLAPCPRLTQRGRPARRIAPVRSSHRWLGVSPSCARPRMNVPGPAPRRPELGAARPRQHLTASWLKSQATAPAFGRPETGRQVLGNPKATRQAEGQFAQCTGVPIESACAF